MNARIPSKSLGSYQITYPESRNITQQKYLIKHNDYIEIIKPAQIKIDEYEKKKNKKKVADTKNWLKSQFGSEWFTDESPLYNALMTGVLESIYGNSVVLFEKHK